MQQQLNIYHEKLKQFHSTKCNTFQKIKNDLKTMIEKIYEEEENIFKLFQTNKTYDYSEDMMKLCDDYKQTIKDKEDEVMKTLALNKMEYDKISNIFNERSLKTIDEMKNLLSNMDSIINQIDTLLQPSDDTSMTSIQNAHSLQQKLTQLISNN